MVAEKTFTIKKQYAEQVYRNEKKYGIRPAQNKYVDLKIPLVGWHWYMRQRLKNLLHAVTQFESIEKRLTAHWAWRKFPQGQT